MIRKTLRNKWISSSYFTRKKKKIPNFNLIDKIGIDSYFFKVLRGLRTAKQNTSTSTGLSRKSFTQSKFSVLIEVFRIKALSPRLSKSDKKIILDDWKE